MDTSKFPSSKGVIAATIDLLAHEYGWSKDHILNLSLGQLRRIMRAITERKKLKTEAWKEAQVSPATGKDVAESLAKKGHRTFDLSENFEEAIRVGKKEGYAIRDR